MSARAGPHEGETAISSPSALPAFAAFVPTCLGLCLVLSACAPEPSVPGVAVMACRTDADCDDGNPCTGTESCQLGTCQQADAVECDAADTCVVRGAAARCEALCPLPRGPAIDVLRDDEYLAVGPGAAVQIAAMPAGEPLPDDVPWSDDDTLVLQGHAGPTRVLARDLHPTCSPSDPADWFDHTYEVRASYPSPSDPRTAPVPADHPHIVGWADAVMAFVPGEDVDTAWLHPEQALGPAEGEPLAVLPLGRGGEVLLRLDPPAADGPGPDLAVFENGFSDGFLELARVEVSSDGRTFAVFDGVSRTEQPVAAYEPIDPASVHGFAGVWRGGLGTPFDLALLHAHPLVRAGQIDLQRIRYVRVVDIVGDGSDRDVMGRPIYDPWPTVGSAGFDLDAIAVLAAP